MKRLALMLIFTLITNMIPLAVFSEDFNTSPGETSVSVAAAESTSLIVNALPYGAEVWLDGSGECAGVTGREIFVAPGNHTVSVRLKGYVSSGEYNVNVETGTQTTLNNIPTLKPDLPASADELTITVTGANDAADGDMSGIAALKANPGADGKISLREAVRACGNENTDNIKRINFDLGLIDVYVDTEWHGDGTGTIVLTDGICINGDSNDDGVPDIAIKDANPSSSSSHIFTAWANDITIASVKFEDIVRGVAFATYNPSKADGGLRMNINNVAVVNCDFQMAAALVTDSVGIQATAAGYHNNNMQYLIDANGNTTQIGSELNFTDFSLTGMTFTGNRFTDIFAIWVVASGNVGGRYDGESGTMTGGYENDNVIFEDLTIAANHSAGSKGLASMALVVTDCNSAEDRHDFPNTEDYTYSENCEIKNVLVRGNAIDVDNLETWGLIASNSNMGNSDNTLSDIVIDYNDIAVESTRPALSLGNTSGNDHKNADASRRNVTKNITVANNRIQTGGSSAIDVCNAAADGGPSQENNHMENILISGNDVEIRLDNTSAAIKVINSWADQEAPHFSNNNTMTDVDIIDNRISYVSNGAETQLPDWDVVNIHNAAIDVKVARSNEWVRRDEQDSVANGNSIANLVIEGNEIFGAVCSLNLEAGRGKNADNNSLSATVYGNSLSGRFYAFENIQDAKDNTITVIGEQNPCKDITSDFTDPNFLSQIKHFTNRTDDFIFDADVAEVTSLSFPSQQISNLSGLGHFKGLETLNCADNSLTEIDVTGLVKLTAIDCTLNYLASKASIIGLNEELTAVNFEPQNTDTPPTLTGTITVNGTAPDSLTPKVGDVLTASFSGNNSGTVTFIWEVDGAETGGNTYMVQAGDVGKTVTVKVACVGQSGTVTATTQAVIPAIEEPGIIPATGIEDITGDAVAMFVFLLISAALWGYILCRRLRRG